MSLNDCYYSPGEDKHTCCSHQHYCIFNKNRDVIERKITKLENSLDKLLTLKNSNILSYYCVDEYNSIINRIRLVRKDLHNLTQFKQKIINKEVTGYGFMEFKKP